jgi:cysteine synthase A
VSAPSLQSSAVGLIGGTPLVELARIAGGRGRLLAKVEFLQPGGSVKDRAARAAIEAARADGRLTAGQAVAEMTSGNMGAGLAVVCAALGHPFHAFMSAGNSIERVRMLEALGAQVTRVPQVDGESGRVTGADIAAAESAARAFAAERGAFYVDQFHNPAVARAHEEGTGPELWAQSGGRLDAFVAIVGTGGTFVGTSRHLKRMTPAPRCFAVEPEGTQPLAGRAVTDPRHLLQGAGYGIVPPLWDPALVDGTLAVSDDEATEMRRRLGVEEGLYVGYSAAANVAAALQLYDRGLVTRGGRVATVLCDTGLKYGLPG